MADSDVIAYRKAVELFKEGRMLEALGLFREAATTGEDRPVEHFALATAYMKTSQFAEARGEYERFFEMGGGEEGQNAAGRKALERMPATATVADKTPRGDLDAVREQYADGVNYYRAGGYQGALERLEPLLESYGRTPELLNTVANCYIGLEAAPRAQALLEEAVAQPDCPPEVFVSLGRLRFDGGCKAALAALAVAVEIAPDNALAWYNKGAVHFARGEYEEAEAAWNKALAFDPHDRQAQVNLEFLSRRPR